MNHSPTQITPVGNSSELIDVSASSVQNMIYTLRGQQVMLDFDLARIYDYEVKALNQQVKRNSGRFPADFMFQLTKDEIELVKSQIVTSPDSSFFAGQAGGRRKAPYAFTEQANLRIQRLPRSIRNIHLFAFITCPISMTGF